MSTYEELWNDINFVNKRIKEQHEYLRSLRVRQLGVGRYQELFWSAVVVLYRFIQQRERLKWK